MRLVSRLYAKTVTTIETSKMAYNVLFSTGYPSAVYLFCAAQLKVHKKGREKNQTIFENVHKKCDNS